MPPGLYNWLLYIFECTVRVWCHIVSVCIRSLNACCYDNASGACRKVPSAKKTTSKTPRQTSTVWLTYSILMFFTSPCASMYLLPSWWHHPCGTALPPRGCCLVGNPAPGRWWSASFGGFCQTSRTRRRWTGRFFRCGPRWRPPPLCPPGHRFSSSCPNRREVEGSPPWPPCP